MNKKPWYTSKTLWVNGLAFAALAVQNSVGFVISAEEQAGAIILINLVLRLVTKSGLGT